MNIAIVVRSLKIGGMERVAANLSDAFDKNGHKTTLVYFKNKPVRIRPENSNTELILIDLNRILLKKIYGIFCIFLSRFINIFFRKSFFIGQGYFFSRIFKKEISKIEKRKGKFDLIIVRGQGTFEMIWDFKDPRIVQVCENIFLSGKNSFKTKLFSRILFNGKKVVCVSNGVIENFKKFQRKTEIVPEKVIMITNPINTDSIKRKSEIISEKVPSSPYLLGLGRFAWQKNFPLLIKAYKIMIDQYNVEQNLYLVGSGREEKTMKELVKKLNLKDRVFFPGSTDNPYLWMKNADIFILSSRFEGLGMVIIEAFASGTNVAATDNPGGVSDIMSIGSLKDQLSQMNPESLAETVSKTLKKDFPKDDIEKALSKFDPDRIVMEYLKFIN